MFQVKDSFFPNFLSLKMITNIVKKEIEGTKNARMMLIHETKNLISEILDHSIDTVVDETNPLKTLINKSKEEFIKNAVKKCQF